MRRLEELFLGCANIQEVKDQAEYGGMVARKHVRKTGSQDQLIGPFVIAIIRQWSANLSGLDKSPHTIKNYFTVARKEMPDWVNSHFRMAPEVLALVDTRAAERQDERAFGVVPFDGKGYSEWVHHWLTNDEGHPARRYIGALAACGRRPVEMVPASFGRIAGDDGNPYNLVRFRGQAKKRGEKSVEVYSIPIIGNASDFMDVVSEHGREWRKLSLGDIREHLRVFASGCDWPVAIPTTPKSLRAMYACYTYATQNMGSKVQQWKWVNQVLGHEPDDVRTPQTYMRFDVKFG